MPSSAFESEKSLIRCAAHSERISDPGMPQTFSVYERKNASYSREPNLDVTHSSNVSACPRERRRVRRYEAPQRADSQTPSRETTSSAFSGYEKNLPR